MVFGVIFRLYKDIFTVATDELHTASWASFRIASPVVIVERQSTAIVASLTMSAIPIAAVLAILYTLIYLSVDMDGMG